MRSKRWSVVFVLAASAAGALGQVPAESAKELIRATGRKAGVCLHIGCGREGAAELTAELAARSGMVVHGLALDEAALSRARAAIAARDVAGRAMVERVPVNPLPYMSNLGTLVVVEDPAGLEAAGITREELLRVTSPGGVLAVWDTGAWVRTVKPAPAGGDSWTHPGHDAGNTRVSRDKLVAFPAGLAWQDGMPMNLVGWAAVRSILVDGGICFAVSTTELENSPGTVGARPKNDEHLVARDAYNGQVIWKQNLHTANRGAALTSANTAPVAVGEGRVYAFCKDRLAAFDAADGAVVAEFRVRYPTVGLRLVDGVLVSAGWEAREMSKEEGLAAAGGLWAPWTPGAAAGAVEAFDVRTGRALWSFEGAAADVLAADGRVYLLTREGNPATAERIVGVDLKTGRELWRLDGAAVAQKPWIHLNAAARGVVVVARHHDKRISVLDGATGKPLWETAGSLKAVTPIVEDEIWNAGKRHDLRTGRVKGTFAVHMGDGMCTPLSVVGPHILIGRGGRYATLGAATASGRLAVTSDSISANRGACVAGLTIGGGMIFTGQNHCMCSPGHMPGFVGLAPAEAPDEAAFTASRAVEKGAAFGEVEAAGLSEGDWPMLRRDAARSASTPVAVPRKLKIAWAVQAIGPRSGPLAAAWNARMRDCITAPVSAGGVVLAAGRETGQVVALDAAGGAQRWRFATGGRIDSPPTIRRGYCFVGSHDGYVYALRLRDGALAWRVRLAPVERRAVSFGAVESSWPVIGSVVVDDQSVYATAGRSARTDGGIVVAALDPDTGATRWIRRVPAEANRQNDLLMLTDGRLAMHQIRIDPGSGEIELEKVVRNKHSSLEGLIDGTWARMAGRRSGGHRVNELRADALVRREEMIWGYAARTRTYFSIRQADTIPPASATGQAAKSPAPSAYAFQAVQPAGTVCESLCLSAGDTLVTAVRVAGKGGEAAGGKLRLLSAEDGRELSSVDLPASPTFEGLVVTPGRLIVALEDGRVVCLQEDK